MDEYDELIANVRAGCEDSAFTGLALLSLLDPLGEKNHAAIPLILYPGLLMVTKIGLVVRYKLDNILIEALRHTQDNSGDIEPTVLAKIIRRSNYHPDFLKVLREKVEKDSLMEAYSIVLLYNEPLPGAFYNEYKILRLGE